MKSLVLLLSLVVVVVLELKEHVNAVPLLKGSLCPPKPRWGPNHRLLRKQNSIAFDYWTEDHEDHLWEHSGLVEGDIMVHQKHLRNGLLNAHSLWPKATVPFYIEPKHFNSSEIMTILKGFQAFHNTTCIRFRPYQKSDNNWLLITGNYSGCWSSVGRRNNGQILNLNTPKCVRHGIVVHELLHALGFYHQQSATKRDEYIRINWNNILPGYEHNFNKYARTYISDYGTEYDYQSVMHYSAKAFTKNGQNTIEPLDPYATLGQRAGLSSKDITKLKQMYAKECKRDNLLNVPEFTDFFDEIFDFFQTSFDDIFT